MSCLSPPTASGLPFTGAPIVQLVTVGVVILVSGALLLLLARKHRSRTAAAALLLLLVVAAGGSLLTLGTGRAVAATAACPLSGGTTAGAEGSAAATLTLTQTSQVSGLGPQVPPRALDGLARNDDKNRVPLHTVTVSISSVVKAAGAAAGDCTAADYRLTEPVMSVMKVLAPGQAVPFAGARIQFVDTDLNQDACQGAVVHLRYVSR